MKNGKIELMLESRLLSQKAHFLVNTLQCTAFPYTIKGLLERTL